MRSKEVDGAIHRLYNSQNNVWEATLYSKEQQEKDIFTTINYISKLEQLPNKIRDKIKLYELEIETLKTLYPKSYTKDDEYKLYVIKIQELKSIIGE